MSRAFQDYPLLQYYFPDELERKKITSYFVSLAIFNGIQYGEVYATSPSLEGIVVWTLSDNYSPTIWREIRAVPLSIIFGFGRCGGARMRGLGKYIDAVHKRLVPSRH